MDPHFYQVNIAWSQDRKGMMCSPELNTSSDHCIEVATPPEFPKGIPGIWSPEHLFTAAVSSCLMTTCTLRYFTSKDPRQYFGVEYTKDVEQLCVSANAFANDNVFATLLRQQALLLNDVEMEKVYFEHEWKPGFSNRVSNHPYRIRTAGQTQLHVLRQ